MSATIDQIQRALLAGKPFVFGKHHLIALRKYLNNSRNIRKSKVLADIWQLIEETAPHSLDEETNLSGMAMLRRLKRADGTFTLDAKRRLGDKELKILENIHHFELAGFWSMSDSTDVSYQRRNYPDFEADKVLPVFRAVAVNGDWFSYILIPWQMYYMKQQTGIQVVG